MAYERHNWACGETITEAKLNNIEEGIEQALECCGGGGSNVFTITFSTTSRPNTSQGRHAVNMENLTADKTFNELLEAYQQGVPIYAFLASLSEIDGTILAIDQLLVSYFPDASGFRFSRSDVSFTTNSIQEIGRQINYSSEMLIGTISSYYANAVE